jgi:hypothetical protein
MLSSVVCGGGASNERTIGCFAQALVASLQPDTFFAQFGDPKTHQITLAQAKEYEQAMKDKL